RQITFLHGNDGASFATPDEAAAQSGPFTFTVHSLAQPAGSFLSFDSGPHQARIFQDSGQFAIAGPDLAGNAHANVITFAPPMVELAGAAFRIGRVVSSSR